MIIASAQIQSEVGRIEANLEKHYYWVLQASHQEVDLMLFPEMSLTGYCRSEAKDLAWTLNDPRLEQLQAYSNDFKMTIIVGAPVLNNGQLYIGSIILSPFQQAIWYAKQYLHEGEEVYFSASMDMNPYIALKGERIQLAICADIANVAHPLAAAKKDCSLYLASIYYTKKGIMEGHACLESYAIKYSMAILMSNYCGQVWQYEAGGKTAFWNADGTRLGLLNTTDEGLLMIEKSEKGWHLKSKEVIGLG